MTFWIFVAILIVVALVIVIVPLLRVEEISEVSREEQNIAIAKDKLVALKQQLESGELTQDQFNSLKEELENSLALDLENQKVAIQNNGGRWLIMVLAILIPLSSVALYKHFGEPDLLDPQAKLAELKESQKAPDINNMSVEDLIALVKKRLKKNPEDGDGWYILGRTFMNIQKYPEAITAYRRAYELVGENPNVMLSLADAISVSQDGKMQGEPEKLVNKALKLAPNNGVGLWLGAIAAEQRNDLPSAYQLWSRLYPLLAGDPKSQAEIKTTLTDLKSTFPEFPDLPFGNDTTVPLTVTLAISIDDSIRSQLKGNEQVFVYAKAVTGPPMPLAAKKLSLSELPLQITLSDADAMMPQLKLSSVDSFTVGARVSMSGNPIPQKGDYFVEVSPLDKNSELSDIKLKIKQVVN